MIIDILFIAAVIIGFWMGYSRGIIRTIFGLLSLFFGLIISLKFAPVTTNILERVLNTESVFVFVMGFILTFVANFINKFAGGALFSMMMVVLLSILVWFADRGGLIDSSTKNASISYPTLTQLPAASKALLEKVRPLFQEFWDDTEKGERNS